jgi:hypothetical protein
MGPETIRLGVSNQHRSEGPETDVGLGNELAQLGIVQEAWNVFFGDFLQLSSTGKSKSRRKACKPRSSREPAKALIRFVIHECDIARSNHIGTLPAFWFGLTDAQ